MRRRAPIDSDTSPIAERTYARAQATHPLPRPSRNPEHAAPRAPQQHDAAPFRRRGAVAPEAGSLLVCAIRTGAARPPLPARDAWNATATRRAGLRVNTAGAVGRTAWPATLGPLWCRCADAPEGRCGAG